MIITKYNIATGSGKETLTIGFVSDLHNSDFQDVLEALKTIKPDLILLAGDILERPKTDNKGYSRREMAEFQNQSAFGIIFHSLFSPFKKKIYSDQGFKFLTEAVKIAPVLMSLGNHECYLSERDVSLESDKFKFLDNKSTSFETKGGNIVEIGGLSTAYDLSFLRTFAKQDGLKILLCHNPEYYSRFIENSDLDCFDLILSGHAHGGQIRIKGRGLWAPCQGFLPKYFHGTYKTAGGAMIVNAGAANNYNIPRLGNPCETVQIKLCL